MNLPIVRRPQLAVHAALFALVVLGVAVTAFTRASHFEPKVDQAVLDGRMAKSFETHYDQQFPARSFGISLWAALDYLIFGEAQSGVVIGKDGWLYTDEEFVVPKNAAQQVQQNFAHIREVRDQLAAHGVKLVVAIVPAKSRVYPEHLSKRKPPELRASLYRLAHDDLRAAGIASPDLLQPLISGKSDGATFLRTDTHWTPQGAAQAAKAIATSVRSVLPASADATAHFTTVTAPKQKHHGDLLNFLPLDPYFSFLLPPLDEVSTASTAADGNDDLLGASAAPRIALVGTSYSANPDWNFVGDLRQSLSEDIANYAKNGEGPFLPMFDYLQSADFKKARPKAVIWELPERYLPYEKPPELAAKKS
jgi:alginate O-acetyltransferase complex protein AlgJ